MLGVGVSSAVLEEGILLLQEQIPEGYVVHGSKQKITNLFLFEMTEKRVNVPIHLIHKHLAEDDIHTHSCLFLFSQFLENLSYAK